MAVKMMLLVKNDENYSVHSSIDGEKAGHAKQPPTDLVTWRLFLHAEPYSLGLSPIGP